jgi:Fuc2NAc and GlcNAc transferase
MPLIIAAPLVAAIAAYALDRLLIRHASRLGLQDLPNARSSHRVPTPRGGGTGIVAAFLLALPLGLAPVPAGWSIWLTVGAAVLLALVGLADDLRSLGLGVRLAAQTFAVAALLASLAGGAPATAESDIGLLALLTGVPAFSEWLSVNAPPWIVMTLDLLLVPLLLLGGLWWINLFNFMDGIDGLAATQALFMLMASLALRLIGSGGETPFAFLLTAPVSTASLILAGAILGFLVLNRPPARLFMGDSGSLFLGFTILAVAAHDVTYGDIGLWSWLVLGSLFLVDATLTLIRRWIRGQRVTDAHRSHLYQRLSRRWGGHGRVVLVYCLLNVAWIFPLALLAQRAPGWAPMILLAAWLPAAAFAWRAGAGLTETESGR